MFVLLVLLALVVVWWCCGGSSVPPIAVAAPPAAGHDAAAPAAAAIPQAEAPERSAANGRPEPASPDPAAAAAAVLRVRLRGVRPEAPWTAPLHLRLEGRDEAADTWLEHSAARAPGPDGVATFGVPAWVRSASRQKGRIEARDPNYLPLLQRREEAPDLEHELVLDVQAAGVLQGRVVDARGEGIAAARVRAFAMEGGVAVDRSLGGANTRADGGYRLQVPPDVPVLLVAAALRPLQMSGLQVVGQDGAIPDDGTVRDDLLPATLATRAGLGAPVSLADLVLPDAAVLNGVLVWSDGRPIAGARVWIEPREGQAFGIADHVAAHALANGGLAPQAMRTTDGDGRFRLPAVAGVTCQLRLEAIDGVAVVGDHPVREATAPTQVVWQVPLPVVLRTVRGGAAVPRARIEVEADWPQSATGRLHLPDLRTDERGELRVLTTLERMHMRATADAQQSAWVTVAAAPPRTVDLELGGTQLGELAIEFTGEFPVRNAGIAWTRSDGATGREALLRDDAHGPFVLRLEPGRYHLRIGPSGGERNGLFLLPIERDVDIGAGAAPTLSLPAEFGGRFTVFATDERGVYVAGTCRVLDGAGGDRTTQFVCRDDGNGMRVGAVGELLAGGPNECGANLPAGDYLLDFVFPEHGALQRRVTVTPREVAEVRVRL